MQQNYINILENEAGTVTVAYASCCGDDPFKMNEVEYIVIEKQDLREIAEHLMHLADEFDEG